MLSKNEAVKFKNKLRLWRIMHPDLRPNTSMAQHCSPYCHRQTICGTSVRGFKVLKENDKTGEIVEFEGNYDYVSRLDQLSNESWDCVEFIRNL